MRRALVAVFAAIALSFAFVPAAHADNGPALAQSSGQQADGASGSPSIVPSPNQRGENNYGGLIVGVVLLGGWALTGYLIFRQARRRRDAASTAAV